MKPKLGSPIIENSLSLLSFPACIVLLLGLSEQGLSDLNKAALPFMHARQVPPAVLAPRLPRSFFF